jgi:cytochrome c
MDLTCTTRTATRIVLTLVVVLATSKFVPAQDMKGDAAAGHQYAETWCSGCHAIDRKAKKSGHVGPDFSSIAKRRSTTARRLTKFFYTQHKNMPNFEIELDDAADVAAYILSLKRR